MFSAIPLAFAALSFNSLARAADADPLQLAVVKQQFVNAKITPDAVPVFDPVATLVANFQTSVGISSVGQPIDKDATATLPALSANGSFDGASTQYTVLMMDADYVGSSSPDGYNFHYLQNNVAVGDDGMVSNTTAAVLPYAGPGPSSGSGAHRYVLLMFAQPSDFSAPASPAANSGVQRYSLTQYLSDAKLGNPLAGTYFTVEVGTATVTAESTTSVDPSTITFASSSTGTGEGTGSSTDTTTAATATGTNGAVSMRAASAMLGVSGVALVLTGLLVVASFVSL